MTQKATAWIFALLVLLQPLHLSLAKEATCISTTHGCIAINADVTQATIKQTICRRGYAQEVRPAVSYTNGVKKLLMKRQGIDASRIHEYELDHIPRWPPENRPYVATSKPANGAESGQEYL